MNRTCMNFTTALSTSPLGHVRLLCSVKGSILFWFLFYIIQYFLTWQTWVTFIEGICKSHSAYPHAVL